MTAHFSDGGHDHQRVKSEDELPLETAWSDEHECVPLRQRLRMLRAKAVPQNRDEMIPDISPINDELVKKEVDLCDSMDFHSDQDGSIRRSGCASSEHSQHGIVHNNESSPLQDRMFSERLGIKYTNIQDDSVTQVWNCHETSSADDIEIAEDFSENLDHVVLKERQRMLLSRKSVRSIRPSMEYKSSDPSTNPVDMILQNSRTGSGESDSCIKLAIQENVTLGKGDGNVKVEPVDDDLDIPNQSLGNQISVKPEAVDDSENLEDIIDQMLLGDRMRLLASRKFSTTILYDNYETVNNDHKSTLSESSKPLVIKRPRKRRKTVTDSVETALEEDAPGLLQVLIQKGVLIDDIKLYGETVGDEPLDESLVEESFSELEEVIAKIFSQQQSLLKFAPIRCARGEKASYCLSCLISLVEQARFLRVKKWPVEWGWCRDLQSFIFVFEKHNRIVLERPEYGYATYFFEIVDTLPVHWQIKRLITAMKLTNCSRSTLIENRALTVGDDLTEGEARVLMEYGWIPNTGLGTMLNYCDRVVHDRKNDSENDSSEWRSKIGKLLTDGYNGGIIVPNDIPKRVMDYGIGYSPEIKLEY